MPPKALRTVRIGQGAKAAGSNALNLLTYKMALAQPTATVPLLGGRHADADGGSSAHASALDASRRWVRDADELCVASIKRSSNINRINSYIATYKFDDPLWRPFLLPEVRVHSSVEDSTDRLHGKSPSAGREAPAPGGAEPPPPHPSASRPSPGGSHEVFIDYNKLVNLELLSRHANFALRHLVQKGHAMYIVNYAQHSLLEARGLVEASYVTCAYGVRGERLRTHLVHVGPLDVRDVVEIDPRSHRVSFNLTKRGVRRGVVAVSLVEGYGTWFQRKPMLWQRTRRIGALQSQLGAFTYHLCPPEEVGKTRDCEVALLRPHVRVHGAGGGAEAVGIIASSQVAQNNRMYMGQFEAPVIAALDAVQQLAHRSALQNHLLRPAGASDGSDEKAEPSESPRRLLDMERLLPVSWVTRTPPPYVPLEGDLPFRLQLSKPSVFHTEQTARRTPERAGAGAPSAGDAEAAPVIFPTGGTVGSPFVKGVPLSLVEYNIDQGVDHYIYDDAPSARPTKWWSQKSNTPYSGYMYFMRSGLLDYVVPAEAITNPLAPEGSATAHQQSGAQSQRRKRGQRRRLRERRRAARKEAAAATADAAHAGETKTDAASDARMDETTASADATDDAQTPTSVAELWDSASSSLAGHDSDALLEENAVVGAEDLVRFRKQQRPQLADLIPPSTLAAARAARYDQRLLRRTTVPSAKPSSAAANDVDGADALLQRQLRRRALHAKQTAKSSKKK